MKTIKSGSYYFLLLTFLLSLASCGFKQKIIKDSQPLQMKKLENNAVPVEMLRFISSNIRTTITDLDIYQAQL